VVRKAFKLRLYIGIGNKTRIAFWSQFCQPQESPDYYTRIKQERPNPFEADIIKDIDRTFPRKIFFKKS
jgi:hypothetical protein